MFCKNCGKEIEDGVVFCSACGEKVGGDKPIEAPQESIPEPASAPTPVPAEPVSFVEPTFEAPKKPKKKKFVGVLLTFVALIVAAAVAVFAFAEPLEGLYVKTFGSEEEYFLFVENKAFQSGTSKVAQQYGNIIENVQKNEGAVNANIKLNIGDSAISMAENALASMGGSIDLNWLKNVSFDIKYDYQKSNGLNQILAALKMNDKNLVDANLIADLKNNEAFVGLLSLNNKYLNIDLENLGIDTQTVMGMYSNNELVNILPNEEKFKALLDKYIEIALGKFDEIEKSSENVTVDDITEELTVLEITINQKNVRDIALAILKEAKSDSEIKNIIKAFANYMSENGMYSSADEMYNECIEGIDYLIEELQGTQVNANEEVAVLTDYVNSKHEVVGRKLEVFDDCIFDYCVVYNKNNFASKFNAPELSIYGGGTKKSNTVNGEFAVVFEGQKLGNIVVSDYKTESEYLNGKINLKPSATLINELGIDSSISSIVSVLDPSLELAIESSEDSAKIDVNILNSNSMLLGYSISVNDSDYSAINKPSANECVSQDAAEEWASSIDFNSIINKLKAAGVPSELADMLLYAF